MWAFLGLQKIYVLKFRSFWYLEVALYTRIIIWIQSSKLKAIHRPVTMNDNDAWSSENENEWDAFEENENDPVAFSPPRKRMKTESDFMKTIRTFEVDALLSRQLQKDSERENNVKQSETKSITCKVTSKYSFVRFMVA